MKKVFPLLLLFAASLIACSKDQEAALPLSKQVVGTYAVQADAVISVPILGDMSLPITDTMVVTNPDGQNLDIALAGTTSVPAIKARIADDGIIHFDPISLDLSTLGALYVSEKSSSLKYADGAISGKAEASVALSVMGQQIMASGGATVTAHKI